MLPMFVKLSVSLLKLAEFKVPTVYWEILTEDILFLGAISTTGMPAMQMQLNKIEP